MSKKAHAGADREDRVQITDQGRVVLVLEVVVDDDFTPSNRYPGDFEYLRRKCKELPADGTSFIGPVRSEGKAKIPMLHRGARRR
jgi:hypothetical protein